MLDFEGFVADRGQSLLRLAYLLTGDAHLAEDLTQDALAKAYRHWTRVCRADHPEAYVRRILVREQLSWWRRSSRRESPHPSPMDGREPVVEDRYPSLEQSEMAATMLDSLPKKQRTVLILRFHLDLSDDEIAVLMNTSPSTVRSNASRALATLRGSVSALEQERTL
ncbi:MAG TPA: SigE family RNA polymerase sigma factor [Actinomycetes bacterium]|nr:SigE family RNA polymerase sigma factor [Actinomycetes bacterium]